MLPRSPLARTLGLALAVALPSSACSVATPVPVELPRSESGTLIVLNTSDDSVTLIDAMTGDRLIELPTGVGPHEVAVAPDGALAVISNYGRADEAGHTLTVIDLGLSKVVATIDLGKHGRPHGVQFLADGRTLVVTAETTGSLLLVDVFGDRVLRAVPTEQSGSHMLALDPGGHRAYVANLGSGSVSVIDLEKAKVIAQIPTAPGAEGLDLSPDGSQLWVANRGSDTVSVIDPARLVQVATFACASGPIRVKFTPDGRRALVSNAGSGDVTVFDVAARTELGRIPLQFSALESTDGRLFGDAAGSAQGGVQSGVQGDALLEARGGESGGALRPDSPMPMGLLISRDGTRAWVASTNADLVTVLDLDSLEVAGRIKVGHEPDGLGWTPVTPLGM